MKKALKVFWKISISLKFAVTVMICLTGSLIIATVLESMFDTPTAQYWIYQTTLFYTLLALLGWLILAVALSRLPWQKKHLPFLAAHLGILLLLYGSWLTFQFGVDGSMQVTEGRSESAVELNEPLLMISEASSVRTIPVPWTPPNATFRPIEIPEFGLVVDTFISRAESKVDFVATSDVRDIPAPALRVKIAGGPKAPPFMRMGQESWLWGGDQSWMRQQVGPTVLGIAPGLDPLPFTAPGPAMNFRVNVAEGKLDVAIQTVDGKKSSLSFPYKDPRELVGKVIATGWKFEATATILDFIPKAISDVRYGPARIQYGSGAPNSAILLKSRQVTPGAPESKVWLGLGDRATLELPSANGTPRKVTIGYFPRRIVLPFALKLDAFKIDRYQGTMNPSEFSSVVSVNGNESGGEEQPKNRLISMNEPMKHGGFTFYQASYVDAQPRPTTSIFSVNQDPGRWLKYLGSLLLVGGTIWLFAMKYVKKKREVPIGNPLEKDHS
ncbi:MAG: cytochrome c biogenesis protein ResB [Cryobacterium sp.]|nr:cytochrome c biogenesis protein ResB [Oligoflexia bacterium]